MAVYRALERFGPMSDEEVFEKLEITMSRSGARTRRKELVDAGLVRDSGLKRRTSSGRRTIVWEVVDD